MELSKKRMLEIAKALEFSSKNTEINCGKCGTTVMQHSEEERVFYEQVVKLLQADQDGRLFKSPCKPGSVIYVLEYEDEKMFVDGKKVHEIEIDEDGELSIYVKDIHGKGEFVYLDDFGETIFLTRESAEEALANGV